MASPRKGGGGELSFSSALISTTSCRIPTSASTNQEPGKTICSPLRASFKSNDCTVERRAQREFFIDNLLVRIYLIVEMI